MPTPADHSDMLARLLPEGPPWQRPEDGSGDETLKLLCDALAIDPARLNLHAELCLQQSIPDNQLTDLDAFERIVGVPKEDLSDAERLANIQALMFGRRKVDLPYLEQIVRAMTDDENVKLFNRAAPPFAAGVSNIGDGLYSGQWDFTWLCSLMPNLIPSPDDFSAWTGFVSKTPNAARSPVTLASTATVFVSGAAPATFLVSGSDQDDRLYFSVWIRCNEWLDEGPPPLTVTIHFIKRDSSTSSPQTYVLATNDFGAFAGAGGWHKLEYEADTGSGPFDPQIVMTFSGGNDFSMSWAVLGVRDTALQSRISALFPVHTTGHFAVQGEYETILAHPDQLKVCL